MKVAIIDVGDERGGFGLAAPILEALLGEAKFDYVDVGGISVPGYVFEFSKEQCGKALMQTRHNARNAGRRKAHIYTKDDSCKGMTWPQFVEATKELSQNKIIETFGLVTCRGEIALGDETRPVSRKLLVERMTKAAEVWEEDPDDTRSFLDYLNWGARY